MQTDNKKIMVAGRERGDLPEQIEAAAAAMRNPQLEKMLIDEQPILAVRDAADEEAHLSRQLQIFGARSQTDIADIQLPQPAGGAALRLINIPRAFVWRLLKFAFERFALKQNIINEQQIITLEKEVRLRRRESAELQRRIEVLEKRLEGGFGNSTEYES